MSVAIGLRFNKLVVTQERAPNTHGQLMVSVSCDCGTFKRSIVLAYLQSGKVSDCGSVIRQHRKYSPLSTHGDTASTEYIIWAAMIQRCENPKRLAYDRYGGRGINVCDRWHTYENFLADMGRRPTPNHSVDRIDNDGNYEPGNCRWATKSEQANNTSRSKINKSGDACQVPIA